MRESCYFAYCFHTLIPDILSVRDGLYVSTLFCDEETAMTCIYVFLLTGVLKNKI